MGCEINKREKSIFHFDFLWYIWEFYLFGTQTVINMKPCENFRKADGATVEPL